MVSLQHIKKVHRVGVAEMVACKTDNQSVPIVITDTRLNSATNHRFCTLPASWR